MRGQVLIFVIFLLVLTGVLTFGLHLLWQTHSMTMALERDNLISFYLAQAAVERGKIATLYGFWTAGSYTRPVAGDATEDPDNDACYNDLDLAASPDHRLKYNFTVQNTGADQRVIRGRGYVMNAADQVISSRQINITVSGIADTVAPLNQEDSNSGDNQCVAQSWQEN